MRQAAKWLTKFFLPATLMATLFCSCENDLKKVRAISLKEFNTQVDSSVGVDVIYSDSAKVKARLETPLMLDFKSAAKPYHEMPKGIKITFFDKNLKPSGTVVSDYAITSNDDKIVTLTKHVVLKSTAGDVFRSEEMVWDQLRKLLYTNQHWEWHRADGTDLNGTRFESNETFTLWNNKDANGVIQMHNAK